MQPPRRKEGQGAAVWKFAQKTLLLHEVLQLVEYNRPNIAENDMSKGLSRSDPCVVWTTSLCCCIWKCVCECAALMLQASPLQPSHACLLQSAGLFHDATKHFEGVLWHLQSVHQEGNGLISHFAFHAQRSKDSIEGLLEVKNDERAGLAIVSGLSLKCSHQMHAVGDGHSPSTSKLLRLHELLKN